LILLIGSAWAVDHAKTTLSAMPRLWRFATLTFGVCLLVGSTQFRYHLSPDVVRFGFPFATGESVLSGGRWLEYPAYPHRTLAVANAFVAFSSPLMVLAFLKRVVFRDRS
jgi:hypothetical protein